jgi:hypothetical protein
MKKIFCMSQAGVSVAPKQPSHAGCACQSMQMFEKITKQNGRFEIFSLYLKVYEIISIYIYMSEIFSMYEWLFEIFSNRALSHVILTRVDQQELMQ